MNKCPKELKNLLLPIKQNTMNWIFSVYQRHFKTFVLSSDKMSHRVSSKMYVL